MNIETAKESQIVSRVKQLENNILRVSELIENLETRLQSVLRAVDDIENHKPEVEEDLVPLAETLRTLSLRAGRHVKDLSSILDRLEL